MESNAEKKKSLESKLICKDGLGKTMEKSNKETSDNFDSGEGQGKHVPVVQSGPYFLNKNDTLLENESHQTHILDNQGGTNPIHQDVLLLSQKNTDPVAFETKEVPNHCMSNEITGQSSNADVDENKMVPQQDENVNYFEDMRKFEKSSKDSDESLKGSTFLFHDIHLSESCC